ncbi:MAG: trypsin-like peptidase domain-containing protein [Burkholderiales bacterium]|nr:trypsin-like peptidase domain-containing protein [Burkholderiales bacterium]
MKKAPLYSRSPRRGLLPAAGSTPPPPPAPASAGAPADAGAGHALGRHRVPSLGGWRAGLVLAVPVVLVVLGLLVLQRLHPPARAVTQGDIDAAVRHALDSGPLPSEAARAYDAVLPSVVRVIALMDEHDQGEGQSEQRALERSLGSGVVLIDNGTILTSLHVVAGARRIRVTYFNGQHSEAVMVGAQPENDLAVLRAESLPDDLEAATIRSTADLRPGDRVIAVGYPFGIGPSVSGGVVSGLKREFRAEGGPRKLTRLIQFDAAANPGNSGGPLVTMDGQVVGIVTAILNPSGQRTFIGIGFAVPIEQAAAAAGTPPF